MELNLPEIQLLTPSSSEPLSRINVFCTHQWPEQNVFHNYMNNVSRGKFHSKNRRFLFAGIHFYFEHSFGQIVVAMKFQSSL